jgi:hypothetical protein
MANAAKPWRRKPFRADKQLLFIDAGATYTEDFGRSPCAPNAAEGELPSVKQSKFRRLDTSEWVSTRSPRWEDVRQTGVSPGPPVSRTSAPDACFWRSAPTRVRFE